MTWWKRPIAALVLVLLLGACGALAACGGDDDSGGSSGGGDSASAPTKLHKGDGEINVLTWETYHNDPWVAQAEKDLGLKINITRAGSVDEVYAKARSGGSDTDLFLVDSGSIDRYRKANLIAPVKVDALKNLKNINPDLDYESINKDGDQLWAVPYNWGIQPLVFDKTKVTPAARTTWKTLFDPKYKGKVMIPDDAYITLPVIALEAGVDPFKWSDADYQKVGQRLSALRGQIRTLTKSFNDQETSMLSGDTVVGYGQTYGFVEKDPELGLSFPKEGTPFWLDNYFFSPKAAKDADVYKFVDYTLTKQWQCRFSNETFQNGILPADVAKTCYKPKIWAGAGGNLVSQLTPDMRKRLVLLRAPDDMDKRLELWNNFKSGA
jgi:spermidine/putrescine transport system substrate-binding protein